MTKLKCIRTSISFALAVPLLGGCAGTTFSFAMNQASPPKSNNIKDLIAHIDDVASIFQTTEKNLSDGPQYFDVPVLAAVVGIGAETISHASAFAFGLTAIVAGAATAADSYYAPAKRADIYADGVKALSCVRIAAEGVSALDDPVPGAPGGPTVLNYYVAAQTDAQAQAPTLVPAITAAIAAPKTIGMAVDNIEARIGYLQRHASTKPDFGTLTTQLKQSITDAQQKTTAAAAAPAAHGGGPELGEVQNHQTLNANLLALSADINACLLPLGS